ncbi:MAG: HAMP domain-containing sensor histidine kinase [Thermodesulfobacteriota bacterium]
MTLRARLTLLFLGALQATFLCALAAYWAVGSWQVLVDDLSLIPGQSVRLDRVLDAAAAARVGPPGADRHVAEALARLEGHVQSRDEARAVEPVATALEEGDPDRLRQAARRLREYYDAQLRQQRRRAEELVQISDGLVVAIVVVVIAAFLVFLAAIRMWLVAPVRVLERGMKVMGTGDLSHRISLSGTDELARLARGINSMAGSLAGIQEKLIASERFALLGELAAYVAHNIRNPLASIRATAQGELVDLDRDDPRRGAFEDIVRACDRVAAWVTDLLRSASPVVLERREGHVDEVVARCAELARPRLAEAGVEVALSLSRTRPVPFDEAKLEQVVSTVLANAIDASPPQGRVEMSVAPEPGAVVVRVMDEGAGIPASRRARLFTPFSSSKPSGTGIGLWLSQKIITAHGGSISLLEAGPVKGTTVEIRLPTARGV